MIRKLVLHRHEILLVSFVVFFPISIRVSNLLFTLLAIDFILTRSFNSKKILVKEYVNILILVSPFLFIAISLSYSNSEIKVLEKYLPLFFIPLLLGVMNLQNMKKKMLHVFLLTILTMSAICIFQGLYNLLFLPESEQVLVGDFFNRTPSKWNALTNKNLMMPFEINPIYMSLYISFAFFILLFKEFKHILIKLSLLGFLVLFQLLIGSRIGLFTFFISLLVAVFYVKSKKLRLYFVAGMICVFALSASMIFVNAVLKKRFISDLSALSLPQKIEGWNALNIRLAIWNCSLIQFKKSPLWGYGVGDQYSVRNECYTEKYTFSGPFGTDLNSHNQYLEFMLIGGVVLLVLLLALLAFSFKIAIFSKSRLHLIFLVLFVLTCFGESLLETHKGIVFFSLFNSLFIFTQSSESDV